MKDTFSISKGIKLSKHQLSNRRSEDTSSLVREQSELSRTVYPALRDADRLSVSTPTNYPIHQCIAKLLRTHARVSDSRSVTCCPRRDPCESPTVQRVHTKDVRSAGAGQPTGPGTRVARSEVPESLLLPSEMHLLVPLEARTLVVPRPRQRCVITT